MPTNLGQLDLSSIDPGRLSRLWSQALPADRVAVTNSTAAAPPVWTTDELCKALRLQLSYLVPQAMAGTHAIPITFGQLLTHPTPDVGLLRRLKDWAKPMMVRDDAELPREVAGVLYFAAVAAARLRCPDWPISDLSPSGILKGTNWALGREWLDASLIPLFDETRTLLKG
jgi:hypothetical protein